MVARGFHTLADHHCDEFVEREDENEEAAEDDDLPEPDNT